MKYILTIFIILFSGLSLVAQESYQETEISEEELFATSTDTVKKKKTHHQLKEVIVNGNQQKKQGSVNRAGIKPMDLPQSVQVIENEIIVQQQAVRMSDVVKNVNGVYVGSARGGAQESFWSRGYDMSTNNMFKNGFRFSGGTIPEISSLERVEVLKGSAALLYGNVAPGGILNMITKSPLFKKGGEISMQMGSYSFYKPSVDVYGPLSKKIAYRFTGSYENSKSFRDIVKRERYYLNPSLLFKASNKTEIVVQGDYLNDDWTPDFGTGSIGKEVADIPRNLYLGAVWSNGKTKQATASGFLKHDFNNNWTLNINTSYQNYDRASKGTERILPKTDPYGYWERPLGQNKNTEQIIAEQFSVQGNFKTGKVKHQLFTGVDLENSFVQAYTFVFNPATYGSGNILDFENFDQGTGIPNATNTKITKTYTNRFGIYAQDLISATEKIKILAGLRWSWQEAQVDTYDLVKNTVSEAPKKMDEAFTPKLGVVYQHNKDVSLFTSYSNAFIPNTGTTVNGEALKPSLIDQYEIGAKKFFFKGLLSSNVTLYRIVNSNLAQMAEFKVDGTNNVDPNVKTLNGETTSKGIEIDVTAKPITGLSIMAGYSYNDMRYTKTSGLNLSYIEGDRLVRTPANTANISFFYTISTGKLRGLSVGSLANYIGDRLGGYNNQIIIDPATGAKSIYDREIPLKGYTTIDVSAGYTWKQFSVLCKLSNIANVLNYTVHENYSVNPIAPRQIMTSLKYKF